MAKPIGLVLAGGRGRRMGLPKGEMVVSGQGLALRAARALQPLCRGVLISLRPGGPNPAPGFAAVEDDLPEGRGPLAGIHAGFQATDERDLLVLACDYPRVETDLLETVLARAAETADLIVITDDTGRLHPLVGLWRRGIAPAVAGQLEEGRFMVRALVERDGTQRLSAADFPGFDLKRLLVNLNRRADLESLEPG